MKNFKYISIFIIILASYLLIGIFGQKEPIAPKENHLPKVDTGGIGRGCGIATAELFFIFSDIDQNDFITAYQIQVDDNSDFSHCLRQNCLFDNRKENRIKETLKSFGSGYYKYLLNEELLPAVYFWRVRVWDSKDAVSNWAEAKLDLEE